MKKTRMHTLLAAALAMAFSPIAAYAERHLIYRLDDGSSGGGGGGEDGGSTGGVVQSTGSEAGSAGGSGGSSMSSTGTGQEGSSASSTGGVSGAFKWGDGWREQIAAGDAKILQRLGRFNSPEDIWRTYRALEARMSAGELKTALKPDATDVERAAWRKENGIPEKPTDYDLTFENGLVIGEEDRPVVNQFLETAHKANMTPGQVKDALSWYYATAEAQTEAMAVKDQKIARDSEDALRGKWGQEFRPNINAVHALLDGAPTGFKDLLLNGRLADGTPMGSSVAGLEWMAQLSRQLNPAATVVPAGTLNMGQALNDEIEKLASMMGNRNSEYWKGPKADANQARYRELIDARDRLAAQGGGKK